tara:strand:- start:16 stop:759 length:744 start_codon:yes stop_codon:yes gene_type:complete
MSKTTIPAGGITDSAVTTAKINADAITGAKIADDAINSEHYTDGSIDTAHVGDSQITAAKTSGIGGRATLIDTITLNNSSTAVFDSSDITSTYDNYLITYENIITGSGNVGLLMRISNNNGSSYEGDSSDDYRRISFNGIENESNNSFTSRYSTATSQITLTGSYVNNGNDAALKIDGHVECFSLNSSSYKKFLGHSIFGQTDDPPKLVFEQAVHVADHTQSAINNLKIFPSSGTMASGTIKLFGLK